jgi:hypothetical protein
MRVEYALPMTESVKRASTRISSKHQVTIPSGPFGEAGLREGDALQVEALGPGQVLLTRVDELIERYAGMLNTGGELRRTTERLREEWR